MQIFLHCEGLLHGVIVILAKTFQPWGKRYRNRHRYFSVQLHDLGKIKSNPGVEESNALRFALLHFFIFFPHCNVCKFCPEWYAGGTTTQSLRLGGSGLCGPKSELTEEIQSVLIFSIHATFGICTPVWMSLIHAYWWAQISFITTPMAESAVFWIFHSQDVLFLGRGGIRVRIYEINIFPFTFRKFFVPNFLKAIFWLNSG